MNASRSWVLLCVLLAAAWTPGMSQPVAARPLGPAMVSARIDAQEITQLVSVGDGRILLNDGVGKRLLLLERNLAVLAVVLDSSAGGNANYGDGGTLVRFGADSAAFFERALGSLLVLTSSGKVARVAAASGGTRGNVVSLDYAATNGLIWVSRVPPLTRKVPAGTRPAAGQPDVELVFEDSLVVVAERLRPRSIDTIAALASGSEVVRTMRPTGDRAVVRQSLFPNPDQLAVMSDGTVAVFRGRTCRLEWLQVDGHLESVELPCAWRSTQAADKQRMADSIGRIRAITFTALLQKWRADSAAAVGEGKPGPYTVATAIAADGQVTRRDVPRERPVRPAGPTVADMPDALPATSHGAVVADADNRLWIRFNRPRAPSSNHLVDEYDVIDRTGRTVDRIGIPRNRRIVGFAPGVVYLVEGLGSALRLEVVPLDAQRRLGR